MTLARLHGFFFCLAALGCNSIFGVDELEPTSSATSGASVSAAASSADGAASSTTSGAGGAGGVAVGGSGGAPPPRRVFVTSDDFSVDQIGYTEHANSLCQQIADSSSNLSGGVWRAWISDLNDNAIDNIVSNGPWNTLDGKLVFDSKADIVDAQVDGLFHPIVLDQDLNSREGEQVWTGTNPQGTTAEVCAEGGESWVPLSANSGTHGYAGQTDELWTSAGTNACPTGKARIYCFEQ